MKLLANLSAGAIALSGLVVFSGSASASLIHVDIGATANEPVTVTSVPADNLLTASEVFAPGWTTDVFTPPGVTGFAITSPVGTAAGSTVTASFDISAVPFSDHMTLFSDTTVGTELDLVFHGVINNSSVLDLTFNQAGGMGSFITGSATYVATVPEATTWVMMVMGFLGLGYAALRRNAKGKVAVSAI